MRLAFFALADLLGMIVDAVAVSLAVDDDDDDEFNKISFTNVLRMVLWRWIFVDLAFNRGW